jgi:hypothetical protein
VAKNRGVLSEKKWGRTLVLSIRVVAAARNARNRRSLILLYRFELIREVVSRSRGALCDRRRAHPVLPRNGVGPCGAWLLEHQPSLRELAKGCSNNFANSFLRALRNR